MPGLVFLPTAEESRIDSGADADSDVLPLPRWGAALISALRANEVLDFHAMAGREPVHVARFRRVQLREARIDIGARHLDLRWRSCDAPLDRADPQQHQRRRDRLPRYCAC